MTTLKAEKRSMDIKAKKLRREGYVTGNLFGHNIAGSVPLKLKKPDVEQLMKECGKGSQVILDVEGEKRNVLIKEISYNFMNKMVEEIDFQALVADERVHSVAEIVLLNHDAVSGGIVEQHLEEIPYVAYPSALVDRIEVDVAGMKVGDTIHVKDLAVAKNPEITLHIDPEKAVVTVSLPHMAAASDAGETEDEAETK